MNATMQSRRKPVSGRNQRGIALMVCIFALLLLSGIAMGLMFMSDTETIINSNYRASQQAHFAALSGLEDGREFLRLRQAAGLPDFNMPGGLQPSLMYIRNPRLVSGVLEAVEPATAGNAFFDTDMCHRGYTALDLASPGAGQPCTTTAPVNQVQYAASTAPLTGTANALHYKWVRITHKANNTAGAPYYVNGSSATLTLNTPVCWTGSQQVLLPTGSASCRDAGMFAVYTVVSLAVSPSGGRRMAETEVSTIGLPPMPAALTLAGQNPVYGSPNSNPFKVNGNNAAGCAGGNTPAIGTLNPPNSNAAVQTIINGIPSNRHNNYTGSTGTAPSVADISSSLADALSTPAGVEELVQLLTMNANQVLDGPVSNPNLGTSGNPLITIVNGNLTMHGRTQGYGILVVTGDYVSAGNSSFDGLILVVGKGSWTVSGGGNGQYNGAIFVAKTRDPNTGDTLDQFGVPMVNWAGGGGNGIQYNSCLINQMAAGLGNRSLSTRLLPY
jgi:hypothetical protein